MQKKSAPENNRLFLRRTFDGADFQRKIESGELAFRIFDLFSTGIEYRPKTLYRVPLRVQVIKGDTDEQAGAGWWDAPAF